jgi:hypothetical protein
MPDLALGDDRAVAVPQQGGGLAVFLPDVRVGQGMAACSVFPLT